MKKLAIIVPYRDRRKHLNVFIPYMRYFMDNFHQDIDYEIFVVEQLNEKFFNRATLLNIGFDVTEHNYDYFCFHDVDLLPMDKTCDYSYVDKPTVLLKYINCEEYKFDVQRFGGTVLFNKEDFLAINGYSNKYWGWGAEDDDLFVRITQQKLSYENKLGKYMALDHISHAGSINPDREEAALTEENMQRVDMVRNNKIDYQADGLNSLTYDIVDMRRMISGGEMISVEL